MAFTDERCPARSPVAPARLAFFKALQPQIPTSRQSTPHSKDVAGLMELQCCPYFATFRHLFLTSGGGLGLVRMVMILSRLPNYIWYTMRTGGRYSERILL
jgi:hypothetical protein